MNPPDEEHEDGGSESFCRTCGVPIVWAKRAEAEARTRSWKDSSRSENHPPLEPIGNVKIVREGVVRTTAAYRLHVCRKDDIELYERLRAAQRGAISAVGATNPQQRRPHVDSPAWRTSHEARLWEIARTSECPKCQAKVDEKCWNLAERRHGRSKHTKTPHVERFPGGKYPLLEDD